MKKYGVAIVNDASSTEKYSVYGQFFHLSECEEAARKLIEEGISEVKIYEINYPNHGLMLNSSWTVKPPVKK